MILHRPSLRAAIAVEIAGQTIRFTPFARIGAAAHVPDDVPHAERLREAARAMPGWVVLEDQHASELLGLLTGTGGYGATPGAVAPRNIQVEAAAVVDPTDKLGTHPRVTAFSQDYGVPVANMPDWLKKAVTNGWDYADLTGAGEHDDITNSGGRGERSHLTAFEMMFSSPPPGWPIEGKVPWDIAGWVAPPNFIAPTRTPVVIPDVPAAEEPDARFRDPAPPDDVLAALASAPTEDAPAAQPGVTDDDLDDIALRLVDLKVTDTIGEALDIIAVARDVPRAEGGGPAPRGKVNTKLRGKKLPTLDEDAYGIIVPLLST